MITAAPLIRVSAWVLHWHWAYHRIGLFLPMRMDALLSGCLGAVLVGMPGFEALYARVESLWILPLGFLLLISPFLISRFYLAYLYTTGYTLQALSDTALILWVSRNPGHIIGRCFNGRAVSFIGVLSYSMYLWQTMATHYINGWWHFVVGASFLLMATVSSWLLIEKPAAALRRSITAKGLPVLAIPMQRES